MIIIIVISVGDIVVIIVVIVAASLIQFLRETLSVTLFVVKDFCLRSSPSNAKVNFS